MRKNYVLIDYENVQPDFMSALDKERFRYTSDQDI